MPTIAQWDTIATRMRLVTTSTRNSLAGVTMAFKATDITVLVS